MHGMTEKKHGLGAALRSMLGALLATGSAGAVAAEEPPPMVLAKTGYFFVGGKIDPSVPGSPVTGQMYVEFFIPKTLSHPLPDRDDPRRQPDRHQLHRHAGRPRRLGAVFRPPRPRRLCGRPGGARPLGAFLAVAGQGRRGQSEAHRAALHRAGERQSCGRRPIKHTQWPGSGQAGDPVFDQFYASQFPSLSSFPKQQQLNTAAGIALFDKIGPAVLMIHSQSGTFIWPIADARPKLVKAVIAVEPNGPPVYETEFKGAPDWFADMGAQEAVGARRDAADLRSAAEARRGAGLRAPGQARCARSGALLAAGGAGAEAPEPRRHSDADRDVGGVVSRLIRPLHRELSDPGGRPQHHDQARRARHPRQRPHDDAGEELRRHRAV